MMATRYSIYILIALCTVLVVSYFSVSFNEPKDVHPADEFVRPLPVLESVPPTFTAPTTTPESVSMSTTTQPELPPIVPLRQILVSTPKNHMDTTVAIVPSLSTTTTLRLTKPSPFSIKKMLDAHNDVREQLYLNPLVWSDSLAASSTEWGDTLVLEDCEFRHNPDTLYGENLYWSWISDSENDGLISTPEEAVEWWADEYRYYNYTKNTCRKGEDCGHYTQIVWRETTEVGCGVSTCFDGDIQTDIWVCRYNPAGNDGTRPY